VVLPRTTLEHACEVASAIRAAMAAIEPIGTCQLTMSYGVVQWREGDDAGGLLARADQALYRAKADGKNTVAE